MSAGITILLRLVLAHIITDFILQPDKWVTDKRHKKIKSLYLYLHGLLTGVVAWLLLGDWTNYQIPLFIAVTHTAIDAIKLYLKDNLVYFLLDQAMHLVILLLSWLYLTDKFASIMPFFGRALDSKEFMVLAVGFAVVIWPVSYIISKATVRWRQEVEDAIAASNSAEAAAGTKDSLDKAGMYIGMFERVLVLIFVLTDQFEAIGFLIAAKSILRFSDRSEHKPRKQTEYVLIGTLISFTVTIVLGLLMKYYL